MAAQKKVTPEKAEKARQMWREGKNPLEIQEFLGCSRVYTFKILRGEFHTGKPKRGTRAVPNAFPPHRMRALFAALQQRYGESYKVETLATRLGVTQRCIYAWMRDEDKSDYRRPGPVARKTLVELEWQLKNLSRQMGEDASQIGEGAAMPDPLPEPGEWNHEAIRALLDRTGMTIETLAGKLGVKYHTIWNYLRDPSLPTHKNPSARVRRALDFIDREYREVTQAVEEDETFLQG